MRIEKKGERRKKREEGGERRGEKKRGDRGDQGDRGKREERGEKSYLGDSIMDNQANIRFVNTHPKCHSCHHSFHFISDKSTMCFTPDILRHLLLSVSL